MCTYRIGGLPGETLEGAIASAGSDHDLVVMGSNGAENVIQKLFGTHSWRVSQRLEIPMMLVPGGTPYRTIKHILLAADVTSIGSFDQLLDLAGPYSSRIHLLHVESLDHRKHADQFLRSTAGNIIQSTGPGIEISFSVIYDNNTALGITRHMLEHGYDLLALGVKHKGMLRSILSPGISKKISGDPLFPIYLFHH